MRRREFFSLVGGAARRFQVWKELEVSGWPRRASRPLGRIPSAPPGNLSRHPHSGDNFSKPVGNHSHSLFSFGVLPGSYLNLATASCVLPFPLARTVITHARPKTSFLFSLIWMPSSKLNRKTDTADDASIDVGDRRQSRDSFLSIKRVNGVSSQVTMTPAMVPSVVRFLTSI
jgi:hypothetical protein